MPIAYDKLTVLITLKRHHNRHRNSRTLFHGDSFSRAPFGDRGRDVVAQDDARLPIVSRHLCYWGMKLCTGMFAAGKLKENVLPSSTLLSTQIFPPCASTSSFAMASPSPTPR